MNSNWKFVFFVVIMCWRFFSILIAFVVLLSKKASAYDPAMPNLRSLDQSHHEHILDIEQCKDSSVSLQIIWENIEAVCEVIAYDSKKGYQEGSYFSNMYFLTNKGNNIRFCRGSVSINSFGYTNHCFGLGYPKFLWEEVRISGVDNTSSALTYTQEVPISYKCYQKHSRQFIKEKNGTPALKLSQIRSIMCSIYDIKGYHNLTPEIYPSWVKCKKNNIPVVIERCEKQDLKNLINWDKIQLVCYHFKRYANNDITDMYFRAVGDRGTFRHCHGLAFKKKSNCFPGPWPGETWDLWEFTNGETKGEANFLGFDSNNVHCYSKKNTMGDENGMKNWYAGQTACGYYDPAGFYGFDKKKHGK